MGESGKKKKGGRKVRVPFRRNRGQRARKKDWTQEALAGDDHDVDAPQVEGVVAKGDLSRHRTIIVDEEGGASGDWHAGIVIAMRGLFAEVDDGTRIWPCTVRRVLRTRLIKERHPVTVGDRVRFSIESTGTDKPEVGVIEQVEPRHGQLRRQAGRREQTIVANVDQALIVGSAAEPLPKPHLIDRYIVAAGAGGIEPIVCINKMDLDASGLGTELVARYASLGHRSLGLSARTGEGIDGLRAMLRDRETVIAGQSGVGKSSLLNAIQPGLALRTGDITAQTGKGRHTTTTARLIRLEIGGYVVDTPGIRAFDLTLIPRGEYEAWFTEFVPILENCRFPDCTHTHEIGCAIKEAVEDGRIHPDRYDSYVHMFEDPGAAI